MKVALHWPECMQTTHNLVPLRQDRNLLYVALRFDYLSKISAFCLRLDYAAKMCPNPRWLILNWILRREWRFLLQTP